MIWKNRNNFNSKSNSAKIYVMKNLKMQLQKKLKVALYRKPYLKRWTVPTFPSIRKLLQNKLKSMSLLVDSVTLTLLLNTCIADSEEVFAYREPVWSSSLYCNF